MSKAVSHNNHNQIFFPMSVIRIGLSLVFLANSLTAFLEPQEFIELIENSFIGDLLIGNTALYIYFIGINDLAVGIFLLLNKKMRLVPWWAALWIVGVIAMIGKPLGIMEEAGFLAMAIALVFFSRSSKLWYKQ